MAEAYDKPEPARDNSETVPSPIQAAWSAAWTIYEPVGERWDEEYDRADAMQDSPEREEAFSRFYKVNLPQYQRARDQFMIVPAPTFKALSQKMQAADPSNDKHFDSCLADIRRLVREQEESL